MDPIFIIGIAFSAVLALLPASLAKAKGRSFGVWYFYGFFVWLIALIHVACITDATRPRRRSAKGPRVARRDAVMAKADARAAKRPPAGSKACPKCAEDVKAAAQVCRFCGHAFQPTLHQTA